MSPTLSFRALYFVPLVLSTGFAVQQSATRPAQFKVAVNLVSVDVIVTDKKGGCPSDLRAGDFEIYEDGVRQEIQDFQWVHIEAPPTAVPSAKPAEAEKTSEKVQPRQGGRKALPSVRLFLLVVDNLNSQWSNLAQVEGAVQNLISKVLQPQDLVAVLTVSRGGLLQNFTNDREALRAATRIAFRSSVQGTAAIGEINRAIEEMQRTAASAQYTGSPEDEAAADAAREDAVRAFSIQNDYGARNALSTLQSMCKSLADVKGRKSVILITEGFGVTAPVQSALNGVVDAANKANVSIYTINPKGLENLDTKPAVALTQQARQRTFTSTGSVTAGNTDFDLIRLESFANSKDEGISELAGSTGGITFRNSNAFQQELENVVRDSHSYYELTYLPKNQALDGKLRRIDVRLASGKKGYTVRARRGYYALDSAGLAGTVDEKMFQALNEAELLDEIHTTLTPAVFLSPEREIVARISLAIGPDHTTLEKAGDRYTGSFRLLAAVLKDGKIVDEFRQDYRLSLDKAGYEEFLQAGTRVAASFKLPPGKYEVDTVLRELGTGKMSTRREDLEIVPYSTELPYLSSIVLSRSVLSSAPDTTKAAEAGEAYDPFRMGNIIVVPSPARIFPREGFLTAFFHVYNVRDPNAEDVALYGYLLNLYRDDLLQSQSEVRPVQSENRHPVNGYILSSRLSLSRIPEGNYRLEVEVAFADGSKRVSRSVSFRID